MAIEVVSITPEERDIILQIQESHFTDVKAIEIKPGKLTEVISAFANSDGGELYVGVDENKTTQTKSWRGFGSIEAANGHIQAFEALFPLGQDFEYTFLECPGDYGLVLKIEVSKTRDIKQASDGVAYIRRGAQKLPAKTHEELKRLEYAKGLTSFETELLTADADAVIDSPQLKEFVTHVVPHTDPTVWLRKQQLLRDNRPVVAGALLFAEEPQALIPKHCGIKIYRYKSDESEGARESLAFQPENVEGCLYQQIKKAVERTVGVVEDIKKLGAKGLEQISYPHETLHEIITNSVIHRDYSLADDIHIRIYDNRIEVESPGRLPAHVTPSNILTERYARNGIVVRLINKFPDPPNKDVGEGLNTAFSAMRKLRLKDPLVEQKQFSVLVVIRHEPLASPEEIILSYLEDNGSIKNKIARQICSIGSENKVKDIFKRLLRAGKIERVPGTAGGQTAYRKRKLPS